MCVRRLAAVFVAAVVSTGFVVISGPAEATAATLECNNTFHARPTTSGWKSDPCASRDYSSDGYVTAAVRVQHYWSMSGGAHITDIRGTYTICNANTASVVRVSADAVALHRRSDFVEYASSVQPQQVSSSCATMITVSKAVRGCGATDDPVGSNAYSSYTEARGAFRTTDDVVVREPTSGGYHTTDSSYYRTVIAGAAC